MSDMGKPAAFAANLRSISGGRKNTITVGVPHKRCGKLCGGMGIIMKQRKKTSVVTRVSAVALAAVLLLSSGSTVFAGKTFAESIHFQEQIKLEDVLYQNNYFGDYVKEKEKENFSDVKDTEIALDLFGYSAFEGDQPEAKNLEGKENVLYIPNTNKSVSWEITVEKAGFYQINLEYLPVDGNTLPVTKGFKVDGEYPYDELSNIKLIRHYVDFFGTDDKGNDLEEPRVNNLGDHVRPSQKEVQEWTKAALYDAQAEYSSPLKIALTAGTHTITMVHIDQPLAIASMSLVAPEQLKSYADVKKEYEAKGYKAASKGVGFEAESKKNILYKTDSAVTLSSSSDSTLTPKGVTQKKYNHIGGGTWSTGGQEIAWEFTVEESGLYKIAPRLQQSYGNGLSSTRQIKIDGVVPFAEFNEYVFTYEDGWQTKALADKDGNPYLIYFEKGTHTISMKVVVGQMTEVVHLLDDVTSRMSNAYRNITMITGQSPDLNYDYNLDKQIPSLMGDLQTIVDELNESITRVDNFANKTTPIVNNLKITIDLLEKIIDDPDDIPASLSDFSSSLTNVGTWLSDVKNQSLALDYFNVLGGEEEVVNKKASVWDTLYGLFANFFLSYTKDYSAIGSLNESTEDYETIEVWVSRSKEWCEILKDLVDTDFTVKHKTNVNLNILPSGMLGSAGGPLLLSINAGTEPDIVVGIGSDVPIDYAIRDAMYDISQFDDYEEVKKLYYKECFVQFTYEGGVYALPEQVSFKSTFVRTDIFDQLGMKVPDTWEEYRDTLLPQLYAYNMQGHVPNWFPVFFYQNGGTMYSDHVYSSNLDSQEAIIGMETLTKFYTDYGVPYALSELNRFRSGECPIVISNFGFYQQLCYSAPELTGKWKMYPIPGTMQEDGTINRSTGDLQGSCIAMLGTIEEDLKDNAWEFMKWYTSAETQSSYARQIESTLGIQARWLPANIEAFNQLPWTTYELEVINESLNWAKETPMGLGTYLMSRCVSNAYNRVVVMGSQTPREAMEQADEELDKEMRRKQIMYRVNLEGKELDD